MPNPKTSRTRNKLRQNAKQAARDAEKLGRKVVSVGKRKKNLTTQCRNWPASGC